MNLSLFIPELSLAATAVVVILLDLFTERKGALAVLSIIGLIVAAAFTVSMRGSMDSAFNGMLAVDGFAIFFKLLFIGIAGIVILASTDYVNKFDRFKGEYYALILISTLGMTLMASTRELVSIYIALETTSIPLYVLAGFLKDEKSSESSLKYLVLGAISSAILLFGMALVFGSTGETQLAGIAQAVQGLGLGSIGDNPGLILGVIMMIGGFGFKIAAIPFHMWVPDVYEGAPTPVAGFLSVASKAAGFAVILRVFTAAFGADDWLSQNWGLIFAVLAAAGMIVGNITAIPQTNIKRMLGYSSIAQAGYLMVGLAGMGVAAASSITGMSGILFFLAGYSLANLAAFTAIIAISNKVESDLIKDFSGMIKRAPWLAVALTIALISLIGMPPAVGFMGKFYVFRSAIEADLLWLVIIAVINSVISAYYYLRVVKVMWLGEPESDEKVPSSGWLKLALFITSAGVLVVGIAPGWLMNLADSASNLF